MKTKRNGAHIFIIFMTMAVLVTIFPALVFADGGKTEKFDHRDALLLPEGYRTWVYLGGSVTPNEMNDGQAAFPEFHNTYMDPQSFQVYKETGKFPEGTTIVKETVDIASKQSLSGNGYFMGHFVGLFAMVKDAGRFPNEPDNWAFFTFKDKADDPLAKKAQAHDTASCSSCHSAGAQERVFTQHYPIIKSAKPH